MPHDRFYIDAPLEGNVVLDGEEFLHLSRVMRKKEGDRIELVNGKNILAQGSIEEISKREARVAVSHQEEKTPLLPSLKLIQALPKMAHLELIIQKGTELGVSHFYLYPSAYSEKKELSNNQTRRLKTILIGAMKQCGRLDLPVLEWGFPSLEGDVYFGDVAPDAPSLTGASLPATLIIGPEKGFTHEEIETLRTQGKGVRLSPYILRAETAAIAGASILATQFSKSDGSSG